MKGYLGARQRSGEGVVRRNGCPKGCFGESVSSLPGFQDISGVSRANLRGEQKKRTLQNTLLDNRFSRDAFAAPLAHSEYCYYKRVRTCFQEEITAPTSKKIAADTLTAHTNCRHQPQSLARRWCTQGVTGWVQGAPERLT